MFLHVLICVTEDRKNPSCGYPIHLLTGETGSISLYATKGLAIELHVRRRRRRPNVGVAPALFS